MKESVSEVKRSRLIWGSPIGSLACTILLGVLASSGLVTDAFAYFVVTMSMVMFGILACAVTAAIYREESERRSVRLEVKSIALFFFLASTASVTSILWIVYPLIDWYLGMWEPIPYTAAKLVLLTIALGAYSVLYFKRSLKPGKLWCVSA